MTTISMKKICAAVMAPSLVLGACQNHEPAPDTAPPPSSAAPVTAACAPMEELARLDARRPVPLQPMMAWHQKQNMMEHLVAIQRITEGLSREDWGEIAQASALIEASPHMQQTCQHMGAGAEGFTEMALDFHRRADAIGAAARAQDAGAVLRATSHTLEACTGCHAAFRQEIVDPATWRDRTAGATAPSL